MQNHVNLIDDGYMYLLKKVAYLLIYNHQWIN